MNRKEYPLSKFYLSLRRRTYLHDLLSDLLQHFREERYLLIFQHPSDLLARCLPQPYRHGKRRLFEMFCSVAAHFRVARMSMTGQAISPIAPKPPIASSHSPSHISMSSSSPLSCHNLGRFTISKRFTSWFYPLPGPQATIDFPHDLLRSGYPRQLIHSMVAGRPHRKTSIRL